MPVTVARTKRFRILPKFFRDYPGRAVLSLAHLVGTTLVKPFSAKMYPDEIEFIAYTSAISDMGGPDRTYPATGTVIPARVQSKQVDAVSPEDGRLSTATLWTILTPADVNARAEDQFRYKGRTLEAVAATIPRGIGDVVFMTKCTETTG